MSNVLLEEFCKIYELGGIVESFLFSDKKTYFVKTAEEHYMIKVLPANINEKKRKKIEISEQLAEIANHTGVSSIYAKRINGKILNEFRDQYYIVSICEGELKANTSVENCSKIGRLLAKLHNTNLSMENLEKFNYGKKLPTVIDWKSYLNIISSEEPKWLIHFKNSIENLHDMFNTSVSTLENFKPQNEVNSHGNIQPQNIIWNKEKPYLIDWKKSCRIDATYECLLTAMRFGIDRNGKRALINTDKMYSFLNEYAKLREIETDRLEIALHMIWYKKLRYLNSALKRYVKSEDETTKKRASSRIIYSLGILESYKEIKYYLSDIEQYFQTVKPEESTKPTSCGNKLQPVNEKYMIKRDISRIGLDKVIQYLNEDKFYLFKGADILDFRNGIDWKYKHPHSSETYQVYLHSLDIICYLCNQYKVTKEVELLEKSLEILNNWIEYDNSSPKKPPAKMWYDHTASSRVLTIIFLNMLSEDILILDEDAIYNCLLKHAQFLYQDKIYRPNNHGIMVDRALILLSIVLATHKDAKNWQRKALGRIKEAFNRDFSHKGTHLENSPDYHSLVMKLFVSTEEFLNINNLTLGEEFHTRLELAKKYFQYLAKPNNTLPMLGDSSSLAKVRVKKIYNNFLDIQAGIAIIQHLDKTDPEQSTWITFICGYGNKSHKHHDDLSFNLFWKGKDIFVDSGKYNYDFDNKYRSYVISPIAHNTITIEGSSYRLGTPLGVLKNITITNFANNSVYDLITGKNMNYDGKEIYRTLVFLKPNIIIIFDKILSNNDKGLQLFKNDNKGLQLFNLAPDVRVTEVKEKSVCIKSGEDTVEIISLVDIDNIKIYHGDRETPRAVISEKFASLTDISQIEISKKGENLEFLTLIKLGETGGSPDIKYNQKIGQLKVKNEIHEFSLIL